MVKTAVEAAIESKPPKGSHRKAEKTNPSNYAPTKRTERTERMPKEQKPQNNTREADS